MLPSNNLIEGISPSSLPPGCSIWHQNCESQQPPDPSSSRQRDSGVCRLEEVPPAMGEKDLSRHVSAGQSAKDLSQLY